VPEDWGIVRPDLTFTNSQGLVRTAKPLLDKMLRLGQEHECCSIALFDYRNVIILVRIKGKDVQQTVNLCTGKHIQGALFQRMKDAFEFTDSACGEMSDQRKSR